MTASDNTPVHRPETRVRHCPKCGSIRVHRSRKRGLLDRGLIGLGGEVCRCHDCRSRHAWFGISPVPIGNRDPDGPAWSGFALGSGAAGLILICWLVKLFADGSL